MPFICLWFLMRKIFNPNLSNVIIHCTFAKNKRKQIFDSKNSIFTNVVAQNWYLVSFSISLFSADKTHSRIGLHCGSTDKLAYTAKVEIAWRHFSVIKCIHWFGFILFSTFNWFSIYLQSASGNGEFTGKAVHISSPTIDSYKSRFR